MEVRDLVDIHKGKMAFVVAAGPSLHYIPEDIFSQIENYIVLSVNSGFLKVGRFCQYFIGDDRGLKNWNYFRKDLPKSNCVKLLYADKLMDYLRFFKRDSKIVLFHHKWWYDPKTDTYNPDGLVFTKGQPLIGARTTAGTAVHFAYIMGCDPIVLLGCDCCYDRNTGFRYFFQFFSKNLQPRRCTGEPVFCKPNRGYYKGGFPVDSHSMQFIDYWKLVALQTRKQGINVINASGGILDCFPRVTLEQVLDKYGEKTK